MGAEQKAQQGEEDEMEEDEPLRENSASFETELHDFDVVGAMKKIIRRWNCACTGS